MLRKLDQIGLLNRSDQELVSRAALKRVKLGGAFESEGPGWTRMNWVTTRDNCSLAANSYSGQIFLGLASLAKSQIIVIHLLYTGLFSLFDARHHRLWFWGQKAHKSAPLVFVSLFLCFLFFCTTFSLLSLFFSGWWARTRKKKTKEQWAAKTSQPTKVSTLEHYLYTRSSPDC